jgi:hypothetical protein
MRNPPRIGRRGALLCFLCFSRGALRLCAGRCRLRAERAVSPRPHGSQSCLGGRYPSCYLKVYPVDVRLIWPVTRRGRPRRRHVPDILSMPAENMLAGAKWQTVSCRPRDEIALRLKHTLLTVPRRLDLILDDVRFPSLAPAQRVQTATGFQ